MLITMIGASGAVGKPTMAALVARGAAVRALTSSDASASALTDRGAAETVVGDLRQAADLERVMDGAGSVFFVMPRFQEDETEAGIRIVDQAKASGVGHFIYCSVFNPQLRHLDHHARKLVVEEHLIESGVPFTILRPAMFMQNLNMEWKDVVERGVYPRPYSPEREMAAIDTSDLGEAAANLILEERFHGGSFDLCGDRLSHGRMAAILSDVMGRSVRAEKSSIDDWADAARGRGASDYFVSAYSKMCAHYDSHGLAGGSPVVLETVLGRPPANYRSFAQRFVRTKLAG